MGEKPKTELKPPGDRPKPPASDPSKKPPEARPKPPQSAEGSRASPSTAQNGGSSQPKRPPTAEGAPKPVSKPQSSPQPKAPASPAPKSLPPTPKKPPSKPSSSAKKSPTSKTQHAGGGGDGKPLKTKMSAIVDILRRWWYCLPDWPPKGFDFAGKLKEKGYRRVEFIKFKIEPAVDAHGLEKVFELDGYKGLYKTAKVVYSPYTCRNLLIG